VELVGEDTAAEEVLVLEVWVLGVWVLELIETETTLAAGDEFNNTVDEVDSAADDMNDIVDGTDGATDGLSGTVIVSTSIIVDVVVDVACLDDLVSKMAPQTSLFADGELIVLFK
jgi:hypothetical protein